MTVGLFQPDGRANPAYLKLDLYCKGLRIDESCALGEDARQIIRNRAGLGSGLEVVIGEGMYTNIPGRVVGAELALLACEKGSGSEGA